MKNSKNHTAKRGLALVVVVSLMALLTVMILGLLMLSSNNRATANNDVSARQADNIAQAGVNTVIADFIQEMRDGASATTNTNDGKTLFTVDTPLSMVPTRAVKSSIPAGTFPTLIKQSASGVPFASGANLTPRASSTSTITKNTDGRFIATESWADPKFFPPGTNLAGNQTPDWIYVTRNGSNPTTFAATNKDSTGSNGNYVVGRYAYQVYDTSGLIDINVAGNFDDPTPPPIERKDTLASIDISQAPLSINRINLTSWRRKASSLLPFDAFVQKWGRERGWQELALDSAETSSDNAFLSRRDLLDYQEANSGIIPPAALQHITTSSLALNRPSWSPQSNGSGASFQYLTDRDASTTINPRVEGVRVTTEFTRRDGTIAKVGEPLMKGRFPLSKLRAFAGGNTSSPDYNAADISSYFGLIPQTTAGNQVISWSRISTNVGQTVNIRTLSQVAAVNREPDFFEVLKAALLSGSLGSTMTVGGWHNISANNLTDLHILRIGANIIDQYDTDNHPTTIHNGILLPPPYEMSVHNAVGVENLPYFQTIGYAVFRRRDLALEPNDSEVSGFLNFQVWNPHSNAAPGTGRIQIGTEGGIVLRIYKKGGKSHISLPGRSGTSATNFIEFDHDAFAVPTLIRPGISNASSNLIGDTIDISGGIKTIGFNAGTTGSGPAMTLPAPYASEPGITNIEKHNNAWGNTPTSTYGGDPIYMMHSNGYRAHVLKVNINGSWVPYQYLEIPGAGDHKIKDLIKCTNEFFAYNGVSATIRGVFADPRTTRHRMWQTEHNIGLSSTGVSNSNVGLNSLNTDFYLSNGTLSPDCANSGWKVQGVAGNNFFPSWFTHNAAASPIVAFDLDGSRRPTDYSAAAGDSPYSGAAKRPRMLNRPFTSVADLGYAFRDEPWRTINLFGDPESPTYQGDAALLDYFSLTESPVVSGSINLNSAPADVIALILSNTSIDETNPINSTTAKSYATTIKNKIQATPLLSTADLAYASSSLAGTTTGDRNEYEVISRGLADTLNTRTWSLFIDVVAQSGNIPNNSSSTSLDQFAGKGQTRHWYQVNIDRFTGEVMSFKREN